MQVGRPSEKRLVSASCKSFRRPPDGCVPLKICTKCKAEKPKSEFHAFHRTKDGLHTQCKACCCQKAKEWRAANQERARARSAKWKAENPQLVKAGSVQYYLKNSERIKENAAKWSSENREKVLGYQAVYRSRNQDKIKTQGKLYQIANPEVARVAQARRRARIRSAEGDHNKSDILKIFDLQKGKCADCKLKLEKSGKGAYHVDHIMPLVRGGGNGPDNLQLLCPRCNLTKQSKDPIEWAQKNGRLL